MSRGRTEDRQFGKEEEKFIREFVSFLDRDSEIRSTNLVPKTSGQARGQTGVKSGFSRAGAGMFALLTWSR